MEEIYSTGQSPSKTRLVGVFAFFLLPILIQCSLLFFVGNPNPKNFAYTYDNVSVAKSILEGKGPLLEGHPPWCRMPGYGFFLALLANPSDHFSIQTHGIFLQIFSLGLTLAFFFYASIRIMPVWVASLIATLIAFLPFRLYYIWVESVMPSIFLFCSAAACLLIEQFYKKQPVQLRYYGLLHLSFALWFFMRTDILPAWFILSFLLHKKNWRYYAIPLSLFLLIGVPWGLFKMKFTGHFTPSTESVGASLMGGLWEIPHKFIWESTDESYFSWMENESQLSTTKEGSDFATREVFRFLCTYPIYTISLIFHKSLLFLKSLWWTHSDTLFFIPWIRLFFISALLLAFVTKYKSFQTFLLSWPIFLNAPLFFLFYSGEGRFWKTSLISLLIGAIPLLCDREFYRHLLQYRPRALCVCTCALLIALFGPTVDDYLVRDEKIRYFSPFLDPKKSSLNKEK